MRTARLMVALVLLAAACGKKDSTSPTDTGGGGGGGGSTTDQISVIDNQFSPGTTTVPPGTTITWTWSGSNPHSVTWNSGGFTSSATQTSGTFQTNFPNAGTFTYHCAVHGSAMSGTIKVVAPTP